MLNAAAPGASKTKRSKHAFVRRCCTHLVPACVVCTQEALACEGYRRLSGACTGRGAPCEQIVYVGWHTGVGAQDTQLDLCMSTHTHTHTHTHAHRCTDTHRHTDIHTDTHVLIWSSQARCSTYTYIYIYIGLGLGFRV